MEAIIRVLRPLVEKSEIANLEHDLNAIAESAVEVWKDAQRDSRRFIIETVPTNGDEEGWRAEVGPNMEPGEGSNMTTAGGEGVLARATSICLFPKIVAISAQDENTLICPGMALFADSPAFALGLEEQNEIDEAMNEGKRKAISDLTARRRTLSAKTLPDGDSGAMTV